MPYLYWKTTYNYNQLSVSLDGGDPITSVSGYMTYWGNSQVVIDTAGEHTVTWTHTKTSDYNSGSDFGLVKDVVVTPKTFYSVRWNNWDGSEIMTDMVEEGTRPYYNGEEPTRAADAQYEYSFIGWSPATDYIYADTVYTAQFYQYTRSYQITWKDDDGTTIDTTSVAYGTTPTHANPKKSGYRFVGWFTAAEDGEKLTSETTVTGEATYYARWEEREGGWDDFHETGGSADWYVVEDGDDEGSWRSGAITHNQYTWASVDVTGPCRVTFQWKVSSENNYDWLSFTLDDSAVDGIDRISGSADWSEKSLVIAEGGTHILKWTYSKDGSTDGGSDCGWVKNLDVAAIATHDVTFQPNYQGADGPVIRSVEDGTAVGELPVVLRSGYRLTGWFTTATGDDQVTAETIVTSDMTVYAQWVECEPEITYELHDSYGDGWNGCAINVVNAGTESVIATLTIPSGGSEESGTIPVVKGMTLRFEWVSGSYVSETSYVIKYSDGTVILSGNGVGFSEPVIYEVPAGESETPETPVIEIDTEKMEAPTEVGDTIVIAAKDGETLTQTDVENLTIKSPTEPEVDITAAYVKALDTEANAIVMRLADPDVDPAGGTLYDPATEEATGLLDDADAVEAAGALAAKPETSGDEEVGALPVKMYPGLWYQASWGSGLGSDSLTHGVKFRAESGQTHIGVIKQKGTSGFYKIDVFEK